MSISTAIDFILLAAIWGGSFLLMKMGAVEFGPFATAFLRVLIASCMLLPLLAWRGQLPALQAKLKPILIVGVMNSGLPFVLFAFAVLHISTGLSSILNATVPLWGALVAWAWLGDRLTTLRVLGLVIGFIGVGLLAWDSASFQAGAALSGLAVLACLAATLLYGIAASFAKKYLMGVPPMASATGSQLGAALVLLVPAWLNIPATMPSGKAWAAIFLLAFFCTAVAYVLYFRIIERAGPARAVTVTFLIPVFGVAYGGVFLNEAITLAMVLCGAIVVLGTALSTGVLAWSRQKKAP